MTTGKIGQLVEQARESGTTQVRHDGVTYDVIYWGTFDINAFKEKP